MPYIIKNGLTYTGNLMPITQAQYEALSEAEKNNGIAYFIVDSDAVLDASDVGLGEGNVEDLAGSVATIETSPATAIHSVGDFILWNGQLYTVISRIEVGQDLTVGSNITATSAGSELTSLKAGLTPIVGTYSTHGITVYKVGRICVLRVDEPSGLSHNQNAWNTYAILDSQFHPIGNVDTVVANNAAGAQTSTPLQLRIDANGAVKVYNFTLSGLMAIGTVTYISKD